MVKQGFWHFSRMHARWSGHSGSEVHSGLIAEMNNSSCKCHAKSCFCLMSAFSLVFLFKYLCSFCNNSSNFINSRYLCYILVLFAYFLVYFDTYFPLVITHISRYLSMLFLTSTNTIYKVSQFHHADYTPNITFLCSNTFFVIVIPFQYLYNDLDSKY